MIRSMRSLRSFLALSLLAFPGSTQALPTPVVLRWGTHPMELTAVWDVPGAVTVTAFFLGGGWSQTSVGDFFDPMDPQLPPALEVLVQAGQSVALVSYRTDAFPAPELSVGDFVAWCRHDPGTDVDGDGQPDGIGLGKAEVRGIGRSAGAAMVLSNGLVEPDPARRFDRVSAFQLATAWLDVFTPGDTKPVWQHYGTTDGTLAGVPASTKLWGSTAYPPLVLPNGSPGWNDTAFLIVDGPGPLECPCPTIQDPTVPVPTACIPPAANPHTSVACNLQALAMWIGGFDVTLTKAAQQDDVVVLAVAFMLP